MLHLKQDIKDLKRLEQIVVIFFEEGFILSPLGT